MCLNLAIVTRAHAPSQVARLRAVVADQLRAAQAAALAPSDADADEEDGFKKILRLQEEKVEGADAGGNIVRCGSYFYFACDLVPVGSVDMRTTYNHHPLTN